MRNFWVTIVLLFGLSCSAAAELVTERHQLADSINTLTGFPSCVPPVFIYRMSVNGNDIFIRANKTLSAVAWTETSVYQLRLSISRWVLGHDYGRVTIYTDGHEVSELIVSPKLPKGDTANLAGRHIALWASHGIYFNTKEQQWRFQRATLWTTVEDIFSVVFARHVAQMLTNAGAEVYQPRGQIGDSAAMTIGPSGYPRWMEAARYWLQYTGAPDSVIYDPNPVITAEGDTLRDQYKEDIHCRTKWVNWLNRDSVHIDACLALHTDGYTIREYDSAMIGTLVIYNEKDIDGSLTFADGRSRFLNRSFANIVQSQIVSDIRRSVCPEWPRRQLLNGDYYEARGPKVPTVLVEMLSHIQMSDMHYGLDPRFQFLMARAIYKGVGRFLEGDSLVVQPLPVKAFGMELAGQELTLKWEERTDPLEPTAMPDYYIIEEQEEDGAWHERAKAYGTTHITFPIGTHTRYQYRVIAANKGGLSYPSETLSCFIGGDSTVLIVNAFDEVRGPEWYADTVCAGIIPGSMPIYDGVAYHYLGAQWQYDRAEEWFSDDAGGCGWGECWRDEAGKPQVGNTHDFPVQIGRQLQRKNISYYSANHKAVNLSEIKNTPIIIFDEKEFTRLREH